MSYQNRTGSRTQKRKPWAESSITEREYQIVCSLRDTHSIKTTAANLKISARRIYNVMANIRKKKLRSQNTVNLIVGFDDPYVKRLMIPVVRPPMEEML